MMIKILKNTAVLLLLFLISQPIIAQGKFKKVVATSSWTAAYARAAGIENVQVLAPMAMIHPAEYELSSKEIRLLLDADLVIYAGYEVMSKFIEQELDSKSMKRFKIDTNYDLISIEQQVSKLAQLNGTNAQAKTHLAEIKKAFNEAKLQIDRFEISKNVIVTHFFQQAFVEGMGLKSVVVFGPAPLEAFQLREIVKCKPNLIVDNFHNPLAGPIIEICPFARSVQLLNFPGQFNTITIADVVRFNAKQLCTFEI